MDCPIRQDGKAPISSVSCRYNGAGIGPALRNKVFKSIKKKKIKLKLTARSYIY